MFTGLIEKICKVAAVIGGSSGMKLQINLGLDAKIGDSIAINGICLTISRFQGGVAEFEVSGETVSRTTLKDLKTGAMGNIERAMSAGGRFGGHFVQGHIDAVAKIKKIERRGDFWHFVFENPKEIKDFLIPKGSVAIDGVSLTIAEVSDNSFSIAIIPTTFDGTIMKYYKTGDMVNIETDILCRIVRTQLVNILPNKNLTMDKLKGLGF
ncbi:MAG: riboflavin synthase subunit alpha [Planctomycetes bacterium GWF2_42_9]|nr:MAG: riboflavin synthase subunit alpha [Planctomycetes bacterium GWF2_42_9]